MTVVDISWTAGGIRDADVASGAGVAATKLKHQYSINAEAYDDATQIAPKSLFLHAVAGASCTVKKFHGAPLTAGGATACTSLIDLEYSTGGASWTSMTSTKIEIPNSATVNEPIAAVLSVTSLSVGDCIRAEITTDGTFTQCSGLGLTLVIEEDAIS